MPPQLLTQFHTAKSGCARRKFRRWVWHKAACITKTPKDFAGFLTQTLSVSSWQRGRGADVQCFQETQPGFPLLASSSECQTIDVVGISSLESREPKEILPASWPSQRGSEDRAVFCLRCHRPSAPVVNQKFLPWILDGSNQTKDSPRSVGVSLHLDRRRSASPWEKKRIVTWEPLGQTKWRLQWLTTLCNHKRATPSEFLAAQK